jgi:hypothetical protein
MRTIAAALAALLLLAGCSSGKKAPAKSAAPVTVSGLLRLFDSESTLNALLTGTTKCNGVGGFSDVADGADVVISDDSGKTLAIAHLQAGFAVIPKSASGSHCDFAFSAEVPSGKGFYGVQVTHRGVVKIAEAALSSVKVSLGAPS